MARLLTLLLLLASTLVLTRIQVAKAQPGESAAPCAGLLGELTGNDVQVRINGSQFAFYLPTRRYGPLNERPQQYLEIPALVELERTSRVCSRTSDPEVYRHTFAGCRCNLLFAKEQRAGVSKSMYTLVVDQCPSPQSHLVTHMYASVSNVTTSEFWNNTMEYSSTSSFAYTSIAGAAKFGIRIENWNWSASGLVDQNNTYLNMAFNFGVKGQQSLTLEPSGFTDYAVVTDFGNFTVKLTLDWGIVLDNKPAIVAYKMNDQPLPLAGATKNWFGFQTNLAFCQPTPDDAGITTGPRAPLGRWSSFYYDPSLQVIFGAVANVVSPSSKPRPAWLLPVVIVIPVFLALIILTIALLVIVVPAVRNKLLPHNRERVQSKRASAATDSKIETWQRAQTPSHL